MSIRTGTEAPAALERNGDEQDTFQNMLSIQIDQPGIGSMSISTSVHPWSQPAPSSPPAS